MNTVDINKILEENNAYIISSNNGKKWCVGECKGTGIDSNGNMFIVADIDYDVNIECGNSDDYYLRLGRVINELDSE